MAEEYAALLAESQPGTDLDVIFEAINYLDKPHHEEWVPQFARINEELGVVIDLIFTGENTDAQSVLDEANANIQKLLDEYWESQ